MSYPPKRSPRRSEVEAVLRLSVKNYWSIPPASQHVLDERLFSFRLIPEDKQDDEEYPIQGRISEFNLEPIDKLIQARAALCTEYKELFEKMHSWIRDAHERRPYWTARVKFGGWLVESRGKLCYYMDADSPEASEIIKVPYRARLGWNEVIYDRVEPRGTVVAVASSEFMIVTCSIKDFIAYMQSAESGDGFDVVQVQRGQVIKQ